jgi:hypothetical protein
MIINTDSEIFTKGKYRDESVWDVADEDPEYLQSLLDSEDVPVNLTKLERELISHAIGIDLDD